MLRSANVFTQCLSRRPPLEPVSLMAALDVVEHEEGIQAGLDILDRFVPLLLAPDAEVLVE